VNAAGILEPTQKGSPEVDEDLMKPNSVVGQESLESQLDPGLADLLERIDELSPGWAEMGREEAVRALLDYSWAQRLYFVVRSGLMGVLGAAVTAGIVAAIGTVNALQVVLISMGSFIVTLAVTRLIDDQMSRMSRAIVSYLSRYRRIQNLIVNHF
jgi:hypothetical protein